MFHYSDETSNVTLMESQICGLWIQMLHSIYQMFARLNLVDSEIKSYNEIPSVSTIYLGK